MKGILIVLLLLKDVRGFLGPQIQAVSCLGKSTGNSLSIAADSISSGRTILQAQKQLTSLPRGISPFEKSLAKARDIQGEFRVISKRAIQEAVRNGLKQLELEFPPLLGGDKSKTAFDDFDNIQELDKNRDWCVQFVPMLQQNPVWLIFPDLKECELAKAEWTGQRYRKAATFSCLEEVAAYYTAGTQYSKPWGATFASGLNQLLGGVASGVNNGDGDDCDGTGDAGLLGDRSALDSLESSGTPAFHLICQPGNGGPVEDWINVEIIHKNAPGNGNVVATIVVNGALDKVRDGYYAPFIFPKLAKTFPFYRNFESVFYLKPISDKGVYGWLYRVYPEPWQVILQTPLKTKNGQTRIEESIALLSDRRPSYTEAVAALLREASSK